MTNEYIKIGRINMTRAKEAKIYCADIYISSNHIKHIQNVHEKELKALGLSAFVYVEYIVKNYTQIRKGDGNSLLLIVLGDLHDNVAAVDLNYSLEKGFWEVKTAQPRKRKDLSKKKLLWWNCPSSK